MTEIKLKVKVEKLRNVLEGNDKSIPRTKVISMLHLTNFPNKEEILGSLLENQNESNGYRHLAISTLGKIDTERAREVLIKNLNISDQRLIASIVLALSRYGDKSSLDAIIGVRQKLTDFARSQAEFAASLISYRLGIAENELPRHSEGDFQGLQPNSKQIAVKKPSQSELDLCFRSIGEKPFGIRPTEKGSVQLTGDKETFIVLLNHEFASAEMIKTLFERKAILGIVSQKNLETQKYFVSYLILTSPRDQGSEISIWVVRSHGKIVLAGNAKPKDGVINFQIRSISQAGAQPIAIEGSIKNDKFDLELASFSPTIPIRKQPTKLK